MKVSSLMKYGGYKKEFLLVHSNVIACIATLFVDVMYF